MTYDLSRITPLTLSQVEGVVQRAFPSGVSRPPSSQAIDHEQLRIRINALLKIAASPVDLSTNASPVNIAKAKRIRKALLAAQKQLDRDGMQICIAMRAADESQRQAQNSLSDLSALHELKERISEVTSWLDIRRVKASSASSKTEAANLQLLAGHLLPVLFQQTFQRKFGSGRTGPGVRFVAAVLSASGIRPETVEALDYICTVRKGLKRSLRLAYGNRLDIRQGEEILEFLEVDFPYIKNPGVRKLGVLLGERTSHVYIKTISAYQFPKAQRRPKARRPTSNLAIRMVEGG